MIKLFDVTMRDGLQDLDKIYTLSEKKELLDKLIQKYIDDYEIGSYPNLSRVPQMIDTTLLYKYAFEKYGAIKNFYILIFNNYGLNNCIENNIYNISFITSYCDTFISKNINKNSIQSLDFIMNSIIKLGKEHKYNYKVYISTFCGSIYNDYNFNKLKNIINILLNFNVSNIALSDTYALLTPNLFETICKDLINEKYDLNLFSLHIHKNDYFDIIIEIALRYGFTKFDVSHIKSGGCVIINKNISSLHNLHIYDIENICLKNHIDFNFNTYNVNDFNNLL